MGKYLCFKERKNIFAIFGFASYNVVLFANLSTGYYPIMGQNMGQRENRREIRKNGQK